MIRLFQNYGFWSVSKGFIIILGFTILPVYLFAETTLTLDHLSSEILRSSDKYEQWDKKWEIEWDEAEEEGKEASFDIRYNRVEGLRVGMRTNIEVIRRKHPKRPNFFGFWGYSFGAKEFQYQIGLEKGFTQKYLFAMGGEYHRQIDTPDRWIIPDLENSLAAFFLREDFHDFYHRDGGSVYFVQHIKNSILLSGGYRVDRLDSLNRNVSWSLFGGSKRFRENPAMSVGEVNSFFGKIIIDTRDNKTRTSNGWYIQLDVEHGGGIAKGEFAFDRILGDIRRYQPLGYQDGIDFRLRMGSGQGNLPWHRLFYLGGLSTLRGFSYKAFPNGPMQEGGNRMILGQVEYRCGQQDLAGEMGFGFFEFVNLILFADVGWVDHVKSDLELYQGFDSLNWKKLKSDVGIGLTNRGGNMRIEIARRTDTGKNPFVFLFRINRPF